MEVAAINCSALMAAVRLLCMYATKHNVTHRQPTLSGSSSLYWLTGRHARGDNVCRRSQEMMDITRSRSRNPVPMWCVRHDIITRFAHNQCGRLSLAAAGRTLDESNYMCRPSELWALNPVISFLDASSSSSSPSGCVQMEFFYCLDEDR